jgi:hypothetical protein
MGALLIIAIVGGLVYMYTKSTPYTPKGFLGGYSETQLAADMYRVRFNGNGNTKTDRSIDLCMLRCAELTLEKGYKYFYIIDSSTGNGGYIPDHRYGPIVSHPTSNNTIKMLHEKPENNLAVYDAAFIVLSYKKKYNIKK